MWDPQVEALSGSFRVVRYDIRGHGDVARAAGPYTIADLGRDLARACSTSSASSGPTSCGLSLGGMIAMWVAANAPERVGPARPALDVRASRPAGGVGRARARRS